MRLIINGIDIELTEKQNISRTLQVNDIVSLSNRQSNYTNTFTIKRTAKNERTFELLGVIGAVTNLPYQRNECYLYTDDGECLIYKGWAVIQSTDTDYKINVYDGNIDLYKAIENKNLGELDLSEINHQKTLSTVVSSFTAGLNYKYIVADYNGLMVYNTNRINIDYLVPSAKVSYLWNKIFSTYGFTYEGSIFNTQDFTNLWLTYPKFAELDVTPVGIFEGSIVTVTNQSSIIQPFQFNQSIVVDTIQDINKQQFIISNAGTYRIELNGTAIYSYGIVDWANQNVGSGSINNANILKNGVFIGTNLDDYIELDLINGDIITVEFPPLPDLGQNSAVNEEYSAQLTLIISEYQGVPISFSNELKDFQTKDFITEILNRFGLTPFKDKYTNHYKFLTLTELLQNNQVVDWSREQNKFVSFNSERYIFGSYSQKNKFTYKYNEQEDDYYNSEIVIDNVNLPDNKVVVNSKVYSPEKTSTLLVHDLITNVYKMWDKEVKDNGDVNYKGLSKRYYLMRESSHTFTSPTSIGSESLSSHQSITTIPVESFINLKFEDVVRDYYASIGSILNFSKIIEASIYLTENDIATIDFSKLYWIKELNNYFLLNKVSNFTKKGITKVELIRVNRINTILQISFPKPAIDLGLNQRFATVKVNVPFTIYQNNYFNPDIYEIATASAGNLITQKSLNEFVFEITTAGVYDFTITMQTKDKSEQVTSNKLIITVI
jgi:hypothetical protein